MMNSDEVPSAPIISSFIIRDRQGFDRRPWSLFYGEAGKRLLDIMLVVMALPVLVPAILLLAACVMMEGGKPFFGHRRIGRGGAPFKCWKLRTMVPNAEGQLKSYLAQNPAAQREWETCFKLTRDPRITRLGHFLRKSSLDELPQIWNILRGTMSIVGPRPVTEDELGMYGGDLHHYQELRPGLTGLWQISGRNDVCYTERVKLDVEYAITFGILMDLRIIRGTFAAVLARTGR